MANSRIRILICFSVTMLIDFFQSNAGETTSCWFGSVECDCFLYEKGIRVNCSKRNLYVIPNMNDSITWLDLSNNKIMTITSKSTKLPERLLSLDLSGNNLKTVNGNPFEHLTRLQSLNLEGNQLNCSNFEKLFRRLLSLEVLNIKGNSGNKTGIAFPGDCFTNLYSLSILKMNGIPSTKFGKSFLHLNKLKFLDMSGTVGICNLEYIDSQMFANFPFLEVLDLSHCNVKDIDKGSFSNIPKLQHLNISYNRQLGFASLPNITYNLNKTKLKSLSINGVNCRAGVGTGIKCFHLLSLKDTNLTELYIASNRLEYFAPGVLRNLPKTLEILSVAENKLTTGLYYLEFSTLENLRVYNLSFQKYPPTFPEGIISDCREKTELCNDADFSCQEVTKQQTSKNIDTSTNVTYFFPRNLEEIYAYSSRLYVQVRKTLISAPNLRIVNLRNNFVNSWEGPVYIQPTNTRMTLDFSNNYCSHISPSILKDGGQVQNLNISHNDIGQDLDKDVHGETFKSLYSLENLDISFCKISKLSNLLVKNSSMLKYLNVSNNQISRWNLKIDHMTNLSSIDLSQNRIRSFDEKNRKHLENAFRKSKLIIDLSDNLLGCSCDNESFLKWLRINKANFVNIQQYQCSPGHMKFSFENLDRSISMLEKNCRSFLTWYLTGSVSLAVCISMLTGVLLVRNRWKIRYIIYKAKLKFRVRDKLNVQNSINLNYEYDVFLSYAGMERNFVRREVLPRLEINAGLRLLVRDRDYLPGLSKVDSIMTGIHESKKVLCVVSKRYLKSKWRDYELNMAKVEEIKDRESSDFVLLILLPEVYNSGYPSKVMDLVKRDSFIEYPEESCAHDDFWEKLVKMLRND
ncbi:toll-like receptor 4 [Saccostrea echinata]|uniref:toll-like receptor 4 n=1 Tax=Saccostrea echinata TaxID=191078 RepID=UPI002A7FA7E6|nr:toll-like receptor 4 [Saccostrea echinata]